MAISKIITSSIADDAIDNTKLDLSADYTFTGTIGGVGGGKVLQVVQHYNKTKTALTASGTVWSGITITPTSSSSKVLILGAICFGSSNMNGGIKFQRGGSDFMPNLDSAYLGHPTTSAGAFATPDNSLGINGSDNLGMVAVNYLDSPSSSSQVSYSIVYTLAGGYSGNVYFNRSTNDTGSQGFSTITLLEIEA
tara:strand:+ start:909 stop:1490 length:582 start_codon:yes stop_codon:yes gene_type:complete